MVNLEKTDEMDIDKISSRLVDTFQQWMNIERLTPYLSRWVICYSDSEKYYEHSYDLEEKIDAFFADPDQKECIVDGGYSLILRGYVYGHNRFHDGEYIHTPPICKIARLGHRALKVPGWYLPISGETFRAVTRSGNEEYYFIADC